MSVCMYKYRINSKRRGVALIMSMLFLVIFAALGVGWATMGNANVQVAKNQSEANKAYNAAQSGLEYGKYMCKNFSSGLTSSTFSVSGSTMEQVWDNFKDYLLDSHSGSLSTYTDDGNDVEVLSLGGENYGVTDFDFVLKFTYSEASPDIITLESEGTDGVFAKQVYMDLGISRDNSVLKYAIASRGRIWLTSDTIVDGDIYSSWDATVYGSAGVETTSSVTNNGTISTLNSIAELDSVNVQMETLDGDGNPMFDGDGNRIYSSDDTVQGYHEGIEYDVSDEDLPGMDEDDYDTSMYESMCTNTISSSWTQKEYFPHQDGNYSGYKSGSKTLYRHVYQNQTFTDAFLPRGRNALFENCTFEGVLYIESTNYTSRTSKCNNVRFDNCEFNGVIVSDVPKNSSIKWRENCLYFTGGARFENEWSQQEATILTPNFNVNLGNTTELEADESSVLEGAVVGGIVDVRGIVEIDGTIISMYDTQAHSSGYVTNIGSTDDDGGSEGGAFIGEEIDISPSDEQLLPEGIQADIIIVHDQETYRES